MANLNSFQSNLKGEFIAENGEGAKWIGMG